MASPASVQFIETALCSTGPFALSYTDPNQKLVIRNHLLSLLQDHPTLTPSFDTFTHNDGTVMNLLYAAGELGVSNGGPPIPITIWLHENYPFVPPIVFVDSSNSPIHSHHPFTDPYGATTTPYMQTWQHPRCNLSKLVHNLIKLFSHDHPFSPSSSVHNGLSHPFLVSKMEALDRLAGSLHYDISTLKATTEEETKELLELQVELVKRVGIANGMVSGLEREKLRLKERAAELAEQSDMVMNWLRVHDRQAWVAAVGDEIENAFEITHADDDDGVDSKLVLDCLAADKAIEDLMYALDEAVERGVVSFQEYIRQVRGLGREQFYKKAMLLKLRGSAPSFIA
ncbi:hypothetical protein FNV43_RR23321 [Rhamnella rubrinervis]|uniref:Protein ELC-like n=1 Tax=Rhamnella rubrinervis TaxID=2594499 RepID=A0A8K0DXV4_9ROSA|nr:hypothetical protein FNV43_RR23321 [Rhamnella rubrinervis]